MKAFLRIILLLTICVISSKFVISSLIPIKDFSDQWTKEDIEQWLDSLSLSKVKKDLIEHNITTGLKLRYLDETFVESEFKNMDKFEKKCSLRNLRN
jgi:hypothetical protein